MNESAPNRKLLWILVACSLLGVPGYFASMATSEFRRFPSPDGRFVAIVQFRSWRSLFMGFRQGDNDVPAFVSIYSSDGAFYGRAPIPYVSFGEGLVWHSDFVEIPGIARWDFSTRTVTTHAYFDPNSKPK